MSGRLVGEVVGWLLTPAASGLTMAERAVLMVIAERANDETREMWRFRNDDQKLFERIQGATGMDKSALTKTLQRLRRNGLEVRIPLMQGKDGRPIFAHNGMAMRFRLPEFPASVELPGRVDTGPPFSPVDNPPEDPPEPEERVDQDPPFPTEGWIDVHPSGLKGGHRSTPKTYEVLTYEGLTYESSPPQSQPEVEDAPAGTADETKIDSGSMRDFDFDYRDALKILMRLDDFGLDLRAEVEKANPALSTQEIVIAAARIAAERIPA